MRAERIKWQLREAGATIKRDKWWALASFVLITIGFRFFG